MGPIDFDDLPERTLLLIDSAPIIYVLEDHPSSGRALRRCLPRTRPDGCALP
jgi:hypothetical protein